MRTKINLTIINEYCCLDPDCGENIVHLYPDLLTDEQKRLFKIHLKICEKCQELFKFYIWLYDRLKRYPQQWAFKRLFDRGKDYYDQANFSNAIKTYSRIIRKTETYGFKNALARALANLASTFLKKGDIRKSERLYKKALNYVEITEDRVFVGGITLNLGSISWYQGNYKDALKYYSKSLEIARKIDDLLGVAQSYDNLALTFWKLGNYSRSLMLYKKSQPFFSKLKNVDYEQTVSYNNMALVYNAIGMYRKSLQLLKKALGTAESKRHRQTKAWIQSSLGDYYLRKDNLLKALKYHRMAFRIYEKIHDVHGQATALIDISGDLIKMKKFNDAQKSLERSVGAVRSGKVKDKSLIAAILLSSSSIMCERQEYNRARANAKSALTIAREINEKELQVHSFLQLSRIYDLQKKHNLALMHARRSFNLAVKLRNQYMIHLTSSQLGVLYEKLGKPEKARKFIALSRIHARRIGDKKLDDKMREYHRWSLETKIFFISVLITKGLRSRLNSLVRIATQPSKNP